MSLIIIDKSRKPDLKVSVKEDGTVVLTQDDKTLRLSAQQFDDMVEVVRPKRKPGCFLVGDKVRVNPEGAYTKDFPTTDLKEGVIYTVTQIVNELSVIVDGTNGPWDKSRFVLDDSPTI